MIKSEIELFRKNNEHVIKHAQRAIKLLNYNLLEEDQENYFTMLFGDEGPANKSKSVNFNSIKQKIRL